MNCCILLLAKQENYESVRVVYNIFTENVCISSYYVNKELNKELHKTWYKNCKLIQKELKINGCAICGYNKCIEALDFHHVNPKDKSFSLNIAGTHHKNKDIVGELNKCILLCKNCHAETHYKMKEN